MARDKTVYTCTACGGTSPKWLGKCPHCGEWNTLEESVAETPSATRHRYKGLAPSAGVATLSQIEAAEIERSPTGMAELDRALGGGIVEGGVVLIGGDPGIGKSTLLLQAAEKLSRSMPVLYVTGEESGAQVALRAQRLGLSAVPVRVLAEIQLERILAAIETEKPRFCVIDSIQTLFSDALTSAPGSVAQVRECAAHLTRTAKALGTSIVLVGHVTKEGTLAGPRVLEHLVDVVLAFEGDRGHAFRVLRATKNRFGSTQEVGVFTMGERGLDVVENPSELFLAERRAGAPGSCVMPVIEGTRPLLLEVQALVAPAG
ncbi:MAG TPA: DNA repair protein RadA, partial [Burkholderiaceae bacterium]|nr:DNA repair protein RadA [Burkholderiaceae bacterium]